MLKPRKRRNVTKKEDKAYLVGGRDYQAKMKETDVEEEKSGNSIFKMYIGGSPNIRGGWGEF